MTDFTLRSTIEAPYDQAVARVRELLSEAGFGVLTEIDMQATLRTKLGVEIEPQVILGACRPQLAHRAIEVDPRVATLLPCNVVVAAEGDSRTRVEIMDPATMSQLSDHPDVAEVASDARERLVGVIDALNAA